MNFGEDLNDLEIVLLAVRKTLRINTLVVAVALVADRLVETRLEHGLLEADKVARHTLSEGFVLVEDGAELGKTEFVELVFQIDVRVRIPHLVELLVVQLLHPLSDLCSHLSLV